MKRALVLIVMVLVVAPSARAEQKAKDSIVRPEVGIRIPGLGRLGVFGPVTHDNMALFFFYDPGRPLAEPEYITLEEGVKSGQVKITEDANGQVTRLLVTNLSDRPLFIQVGELVRGGKQDRTMQASLIVPSSTRKMPIPSFCVEQARWSDGKDFAVDGILLPDNAAKVANLNRSQGRVWSSVAKYKSRARTNTASSSGREVKASRTSSVNEELGDKDFQKLIKRYESKLVLPPRLARPRGLAVVIDGRISSVDVYHASSLFKKLYPKLLRSASAEAAAGKFKVKPPGVSVRDLKVFLAGAWDGKKHREKLGHDNVFVRIVGTGSVAAQLFYKDSLVHVQVLKTDVAAPAPMPRSDRRDRTPPALPRGGRAPRSQRGNGD